MTEEKASLTAAQAIEGADIRRVQVAGKELVLIGTAHISRESVDMVERVIESERPDTVCVELDAQRYRVLKDQNQWQNLNLFQVIRRGQAPFLLASMALSTFQRRLGLQTGVRPGAELAAAADRAEKLDCELVLADRELRTTLLRAWRKTGLWRKMKLLAAMLASLFDQQEIDEAELARLRQSDTLSVLLEELGEHLPEVKTILVDERDRLMADRILRTGGKKIVAVVGAAHLGGILNNLETPLAEEERREMEQVPAKPLSSKLIPWAIPVVVLLLFVGGFLFGSREQLAEAAVAWVLANGLLSALGALIALGHPLTVVAAFFAAPVTSLNPTIGAGLVTGLVQTCVAPPKVIDLERVSEDLTSLTGWWRNRVSRVLLVFAFSSIGSALGTLVAFHWLKDLW